MTTRIDRQFASIKRENRAALITYMMAGDPNYATSLAILKALPKAGADIIELGMPFSDPMADGPIIQAAGIRALSGGQTLAKTLAMVADFRQQDENTPIVLMGYYNPIYVYGVDRFLAQAQNAGIDGLLIVDLPPEMDSELCLPASAAGLNFIRLATPTTDRQRLPTVLKNISGFLYYVSITGITGQANKDFHRVGDALSAIREKSTLPIAVGFGIKTREQVTEVAQFADGVVVGSAIVEAIACATQTMPNKADAAVCAAAKLIAELSSGLKKVGEKVNGPK